MHKRRTVLGLSCGVGISLFPFKDDTFILGNIETRTDFYIKGLPIQYQLNFPGSPMWADPQGYKTLTPGSADIILSQPKCGNSSMLALSRGKKLTSHEGDPSLDLALQGIRYLKPKVFLLENLPALLETYSERELRAYLELYRLTFHHTSVSVFGNSQKTRKRLLILGVHKHLKGAGALHRSFNILPKMPYLKPTGTLIEACPENGFFRPDINERIAIYGGKQMTYAEIQQLWESIPTKKRLVTPEENFSTAPGVYRDLSGDLPATIRKSNRCFAPYGLPYTPRERGRIQGVPDRFRIADSLTNPDISPKTLFNKGCTAMANTPPMEVSHWFRQVLIEANFL